MVEGINNRMAQQIRQLTVLGDQIADTQTRISSGKKLLRSSDDVIASARIAQLRRAQSANTSWNVNLELAQSLNSQAQTAITTASDQVARLSELLLTAASEQGSASDRASVASEIRNIADTLDELAATKSSLGNPLFDQTKAVALRVGPDTTLEPVLKRAAVFDRSGVSLSDTIRQMATDVENDDKAAIDAAIDDVSNIVSHFADANGRLGLIAQRIERMSEAIFARNTELTNEKSELADTNMTEAIAQLNQLTLTQNAAQAAFARINRTTLMDLLG